MERTLQTNGKAAQKLLGKAFCVLEKNPPNIKKIMSLPLPFNPAHSLQETLMIPHYSVTPRSWCSRVEACLRQGAWLCVDAGAEPRARGRSITQSQLDAGRYKTCFLIQPLCPSDRRKPAEGWMGGWWNTRVIYLAVIRNQLNHPGVNGIEITWPGTIMGNMLAEN